MSAPAAETWFVAFPITRSALLLRPAADPERELDLGVLAPVTCPLIRGSSTDADRPLMSICLLACG